MNASAYKSRAVAVLVLSGLTASQGRAVERALPAAGVNFSGAEYGGVKARINHDYHYPEESDFAWAKSNGFAMIRLPFSWERLQPTLNGELDKEELERLSSSVTRARAHGLATVLDPHAYATWGGDLIGSPKVPISAFADFWRRLATRFRSEKDVIFGLMNEPKSSIPKWAETAQAAIDAVRATGACNLALIPGANWTGAHSWNAVIDGASNAQAIGAVKDSGPHAIEFHQYLDHDSSGEHGDCRKPEETVAALSVATDWLRKTRKKGFLGEFGAGPGAQCQAGLDAMLAHMRDTRHGALPLNDGSVDVEGREVFAEFAPFYDFTRVKWNDMHGIISNQNDALSSKGFTAARHELAPGVTVDVYDLHADAGGDQGDIDARLKNFAQLQTFMRTYSAGRPVIVAGDTNLNVNRAGDMAILSDFLGTNGLVDSARSLGKGESLDRVMLRSTADVSLEAVFWEKAPEFFDAAGQPLSDHGAVHVDILWKRLR